MVGDLRCFLRKQAGKAFLLSTVWAFAAGCLLYVTAGLVVGDAWVEAAFVGVATIVMGCKAVKCGRLAGDLLGDLDDIEEQLLED